MNAQVQVNTSPADLIASANNAINNAIIYDSEQKFAMADLNRSDATLLIELALDAEESFRGAVRAFLNGALELIQKQYNPAGKEANWAVALREEEGTRYIRIVRGTSISGPEHMQWSAHCFIDKTNGDVLMAAGYKKPAKHARSNIYNASNGVDGMTAYGARYLK